MFLYLYAVYNHQNPCSFIPPFFRKRRIVKIVYKAEGRSNLTGDPGKLLIFRCILRFKPKNSCFLIVPPLENHFDPDNNGIFTAMGT
jgi:hypothetical protein